MKCITKTAKYFLFLLNFLILIGGLIFIAFGIAILVDQNKGLDSFTDLNYGNFTITVGIVISIIAFFGCCGAIKRNNCMLITYAVILILLFILQVVLGALAIVAATKDINALNTTVYDLVEDVFEDYVNYPIDEDKRKAVNRIQETFDCCGVSGRDYWKHKPDPLLESCHGHYIGCAITFRDLILDNIKVIAGLAIGFSILELCGATFAFMVKRYRSKWD